MLTGFDAETSGIGLKYLIYLSYWGFILWNSYLLVAAVSTTVNFMLQSHYETDSPRASPHHFTNGSGITWQEKIHWALFTLGTEFAVGISILFWILFYDPEAKDFIFSPISLHMHLINGVFALVELWVTGIPIHLLHVVYIMLFGCTYVAFTVLYYAFNGTDAAGNHYIYPILDYGANPGGATGLVIGCILGYLTAIHLLFYVQYLARQWITDHIYSRRTNNTKMQCRYNQLEYSTTASEDDLYKCV